MVLLWVLPPLSIAMGGALGLLLDSRAAAGIVLLVGAGLWIAVFAAEVSRETPRRDRLRGSGIDFGRGG
ncbi:MAG: hypothetical protein RMK29_15405 [Myxococcales bacterium]|nr:hypothetical protein [Myxococcales bacterium]